MDFDLTDEQKLFAESVNRFMQEAHPFSQHHQRTVGNDEARRLQTKLWSQMAEMGWLQIAFSEIDGGLDATPIDTMLLMQAFGQGLVTAPYLSSIVMAGDILKHSVLSPQRTERLTQLMNGEMTIALAYGEKASRYDFTSITTTATPTANGWHLYGEKTIVSHGDTASHLIVSAKCDSGISLFFLSNHATGIKHHAYPMLDGSNGADITFNQVFVHHDALLSDAHNGLSLLSSSIDAGVVAIGAEALGIMQSLLDMTVSYCQARVQFGQPIGKFQVIQHRLVDMLMETEQTRSLVYLATIRLAEAPAIHTPSSRALLTKAICAMKVQVGKAGRFIGQEAIQLHGGMGMSNDVIIGHYFRRLTAIDAMLGNVDYHLRRFVDCGADSQK
jgi:alkylation response protein AidB-like acyl-CoA dehydrogenase